MSFKKFQSPHLFLAKKYWAELLKPGDVVVDATCGNGHDTLFLANLVLTENSGGVHAIDIQEIAIQETQKKIEENLLSKAPRVSYFQMSHENIDKLPFEKKPKLIVYNLGYLPGGEKSITTHTHSTLESVEKAMHLISLDGAISITCYPRHEEGGIETSALENYLKSIDPNKFVICAHKYLNRPYSPFLIWIASSIR